MLKQTNVLYLGKAKPSGGGGGGAVDASQVSYINGQITNVQEALDSLLYVNPSITSFTGGSTLEMGQSVNKINLAWAVNKTIISQSLNQGIGSLAPNVRSYVYEPANPITTNTTFTLTVNDGKKSASASTAINFRLKRYWGVSTNTTLTDAQIIGLSSELATARQMTKTFNATGGRYIFIVLPTSWCNGISFKLNDLAFSDFVIETNRAFTNASGYTSNYNVYRVANIQTGNAIKIEVL